MNAIEIEPLRFDRENDIFFIVFDLFGADVRINSEILLNEFYAKIHTNFLDLQQVFLYYYALISC